MEKKLQVFISSTYVDLIEERQAVVEAVLNSGHIPAGMELFKAGPAQETIIKEWIEASDVYILLLGSRYGSLNDSKISYTHWEYNYAKDQGIPMFSLVLSDQYINEMVINNRIKVTETETSDSKYIKFKAEVTSKLVVQVSHISDIKLGVTDGLRDVEKRFGNDLEGWVRGSFYDELIKLRINFQELSVNHIERQNEVIELKDNVLSIKDSYLGEYHFSFVVEQLKMRSISLDDIKNKITISEKEIEEMKLDQFSGNVKHLEEHLDELHKMYKKNAVSVLEVIIENKDKFLMDEFKIYYHNKIHDLYVEFVCPILNQFSLATLESVSGIGTHTRSYRKITLTEIGKKFFVLLDHENS